MLELSYKELLGVLAILISAPQIYYYFKSILKGETKPHIYTKTIWSIVTAIGFIVTIKAGGGPGSWVIGTTCLIQFIGLSLCFKYGSRDIRILDTELLILALLCIPLYLFVDNKTYTLILIIFIDFLGYLPTYRKTYKAPESESIIAWSLSVFKYIIALFALIEYSFFTLAYPVFLISANSILVLIILWRKKSQNKKSEQ